MKTLAAGFLCMLVIILGLFALVPIIDGTDRYRQDRAHCPNDYITEPCK